MDIGLAQKACWSDELTNSAPVRAKHYVESMWSEGKMMHTH